MKRLIPFVIVLCCALGLILGSVSALTDCSNDLVFTEIVHYGDPAVLDGRVIESGIQCGDHMEWHTAYRFGQEDVYDTEFVFTQNVGWDGAAPSGSQFEIYTYGGFSSSSTGEQELRATGYGQMVRAVAAVTPDGETKKMNLKLRDYVDYHGISYTLYYVSEKYHCSESVDFSDYFSTVWDDDPADFAEWVELYGNYSFLGLTELFRFPVGEEEIVEVSATRNGYGLLTGMDYYPQNGPDISVICCLNDLGAYCIPRYRSSYDASEIQTGEYRDGMGLYFIPWRELEGKQQSVEAGGELRTLQVVALDTDRAENILPMDGDVIVYGLEVAEDGKSAWMISLEDGWYVLTRLDLENARVMERLEVLPLTQDSEYLWPDWQIRGEKMMLKACEQIALVDLSVPAVELAVPLGPVIDGFWEVISDECGIFYDGEVLIMAGARNWDTVLDVIAFDSSGPLYWGEYKCSVMECNDPGFSPYIQNKNGMVIIR